MAAHEQLLLSGPGRGWNPIKGALHRDLAQRFAGEATAHMQGEAGDGNVRLVLM